MKKPLVEKELAGFTPPRETALTIGVFDGVHLGHQHLIASVKRKAAEKGFLSGVITFRNHPRLVLSPHAKLTYLTSLPERIELLKSQGVDLVVPLTFTHDLARLSAREFVILLMKYLKMKALVVGPDFSFGRGREGSGPHLQELGRELNFTVDVAEPMMWQGETVSSTAIRQALSQGDMRKASKLLGRPFRLGGQVVEGDRRGRLLGFPTANIVPNSDKALPPDGVYVTRAILGSRVYKSVTNIGVRPTFDGGKRLIEVYLLDFEDGEFYGEELQIELVERLRGEVRFANVEELKAQMANDVKEAERILAREEDARVRERSG